jgi:hypothetical protein
MQSDEHRSILSAQECDKARKRQKNIKTATAFGMMKRTGHQIVVDTIREARRALSDFTDPGGASLVRYLITVSVVIVAAFLVLMARYS